MISFGAVVIAFVKIYISRIMYLLLLASISISCNAAQVDPIDTDGDGVPDSLDAFPTYRHEWNDLDGDGYGDNYSDLDIDGDGVPNDRERRLSTDPFDLNSFPADLNHNNIFDVFEGDFELQVAQNEVYRPKDLGVLRFFIEGLQASNVHDVQLYSTDSNGSILNVLGSMSQEKVVSFQGAHIFSIDISVDDYQLGFTYYKAIATLLDGAVLSSQIQIFEVAYEGYYDQDDDINGYIFEEVNGERKLLNVVIIQYLDYVDFSVVKKLADSINGEVLLFSPVRRVVNIKVPITTAEEYLEVIDRLSNDPKKYFPITAPNVPEDSIQYFNEVIVDKPRNALE